MEQDYSNMRMPDLRVRASEHELRGYSRLRKAELIALLPDSLPPRHGSNPTKSAPRHGSDPEELQDMARDQARDLLHMANAQA